MIILKTDYQLQLMAQSSEAIELHRVLSRLSLKDRIQSVQNIDINLKAALSIGLADKRKALRDTHLYGALIFQPQHNDLSPNCVHYLQALEVPHFNIYDEHVVSKRNVQDLLLDVAQNNNLRNNPQTENLHECITYVASKTSGMNANHDIGSKAMLDAIWTGDLKIVEIFHRAGVDIGDKLCRPEWNFAAKSYDNSHQGSDYLRRYSALRNQLMLEGSAHGTRKSRAIL